MMVDQLVDSAEHDPAVVETPLDGLYGVIDEWSSGGEEPTHQAHQVRRACRAQAGATPT